MTSLRLPPCQGHLRAITHPIRVTLHSKAAGGVSITPHTTTTCTRQALSITTNRHPKIFILQRKSCLSKRAIRVHLRATTFIMGLVKELVTSNMGLKNQAVFSMGKRRLLTSLKAT